MAKEKKSGVRGFRIDEAVLSKVLEVCEKEQISESLFYQKAVSYFLENALKIKIERKSVFFNNF